MGEVIKLKVPDDREEWVPDFVVKARSTETGYEVCVEELDTGEPTRPGAIFRRVAAQLIPIANGLHSQAEDLAPTNQGKIISQITIYEDGTTDMHMVPLPEPLQRQWVITALKAVIAHVRKGLKP